MGALKKAEVQVTPQQLALFQTVIDTNFSNAVELYDSMPKYVYGRHVAFRESELPAERHVLERVWNHAAKVDGSTMLQKCYLRLSPATIIRKKAGKMERFYVYPGRREQIVEAAIRKIAVDNGATLSEGVVGCKFFIRQVRSLVEEAGHTMKHQDVVEAINVMNKCHLEYGFVEDDGKTRVSGRSALFPQIFVRTRDDGEDMYSAVEFHQLVNRSIKDRTFRQIDFKTNIRLKLMLSSYLHQRISTQFLQASPNASYRFRLAELAMNSCFAQNLAGETEMPVKEQVRCVKEALEELKEQQVVASYEVIPIPDPSDRRKRIDTAFELKVTPSFVHSMILMNAHSKQLRQEAP